MSAIIAALMLPIPLAHLWLHALLPWWKKYPRLFYFWGFIIWDGAFAIVPTLDIISPIAIYPTSFLRGIGLILIATGLVAIIWSALTLGARRFFVWAVLRPESTSQIRINHGPFEWLPHPAYSGYVLLALGNFLINGKLYLAGILLYTLITLPIVIWLEDHELGQRID
ncbi:MAG: hypothetical protein HY984_02115 [Candidatus Magasanikbacteria bacterium]|nr:hypothetical protein [Candidatus Magasanikbacteria bacterium]